MRYFLDTNTIIYAIKGSFKQVEDHFRSVPMESIVIPSVVVAEIEYGAYKSSNYKKTIEKYNEFIRHFDIIGFNEDASRVYGKIRSDLEKLGSPIGPNDLIIASIVIAENGTLITHNTKEFSRIKDLKIEDWTK